MAPQAPSEVPEVLPEKEVDAPRLQEISSEERRVALRLTASRGTLGLELYEPVELGPVRVNALRVGLPGLKFPLDLSGGVPKFRHRRGDLEHVELGFDFEALEQFLERKLAEVAEFSAVRPPSVWSVPSGLGVGLVGQDRALAFELWWAPEGKDARFVVANARGVGLEVPAIGVALRVLDSGLGGLFERSGRTVRMERVGERVSRALLPAVGVRAPAAGRVHFVAFKSAESGISVTLDASQGEPELGVDILRMLELARLTVSGDDALARGESERARECYVVALERAPRHPELARLIAEIDAQVDARAEAALGLLGESMPAMQAGLVGALLLYRVGDVMGARAAVEHAVRGEPYAPLAALAWLRAAELEPEPARRFRALDRAVAQAPGLRAPRWARFVARVGRGDVSGALADGEHLEASERGARARHRALMDAGRVLLEGGFVRDAGRMFERALRYLPDDAGATAGLARALALAGRPERALTLLERASALAEAAGEPDADALLDLAKLLADTAGDLPQAIARVREVTAASPRHLEARYLEGLWRARLGDRAGAALAFGRLREGVELELEFARPEWATWLVHAAEHALSVDQDAITAERHLATALRLRPQDPEIAEKYREVAAKLSVRSQ